MKTKRKRPMRRLMCLVTASVLAAGFIIALPAPGGTAHAVDLGETCSLTVTVEPKQMDGGELESPDVVLDLYKVAKAAEVPGYDTYSYDAEGTIYTGLDLEDVEDNEGWMELAQQAAALTFDNGAVPDAIADELVGDKLTAANLDAGLYLVIARGRDMAAEDYIASEEVPGEDGGEASHRIVTIACSSSYTFTYQPQLISLPTKESEDGNPMTSDSGDWIYSPSVVLKPELSLRFASLAIQKTLSSYRNDRPATFVFEVTATVPGAGGAAGEVAYHDFISMTFTAAGTQSVLLAAEFEADDAGNYSQLKAARLPVGAEVTVTEVYSGANYSVTGNAEVNIDALGIADNVAAFTNAYNGSGNNGGSITNQFNYSTADGWSWEPVAGPNASARQ